MDDTIFRQLGYTEKAAGAGIPRLLLKNGMKAALFDIDGTLLDSMPLWDTLGERYLAGRGKTPEEGLRDILFPMTIRESVQYLKTAYCLPDTEEEIRNGLFRVTEDFYKNKVPLKKGAGTLLHALSKAGIPMALCTIGEAELEKAALSRLEVLPLFQGFFA